MVSSVDLDNMPSDIVVMLAAQSIAEKSPGSEIGHVVGALSTHGTSRGLSGGSINGILEAVTSPRDSSHDPLESERKGGRMSFLSRLPDGSFASLSPFGPTNSKFVHRTQEIYDIQAPKLSYGTAFEYEGHWKHDSFFRALVFSFGQIMMILLFVLPWSRKLIQVYGPKTGDGPDHKINQDADFSMTAWAASANGKSRSKVTLYGSGHPGYHATAKMSVEAALAIAFDREQLPKLGREGGVLTPAAALGPVIVERLKRTGQFKFVKE